ncbi:tautomerase family protein [Leptospira interrogans]|uniref:4-oxalocrotonate tautomerase family enzyme n=8 Tax=Leptospira interrogans TaxID=173 RepID=M3FWA9_LEPIR|nr:tautomerase family protein [Leptospira interrogans]EMG11689.1 4-oxalocrotonate tautomerase family enzyme [Leptospira interrogans serovar Grippotyphosa str. LT2186]EMM96713.1 4-oxalocrotonate tautomerase family enzyme [Leptospira interrogans serovar Zanoni str. LT2156]OBZ99827.1 4-oxalocrotonate tautomerase family enzyme [Leptospira interrogans serovar Copenhageni/Icterohaemorrhagiae]OCC29230.1 4-oxalocrotonate tautomerase family enzyme [Leptospira interrogans serovar Canicola]AAS70181.1 tau
MPLVQIFVPAGSLSADMKNDMIQKVTDAVVEAEGKPVVRRYTWVHINEVPDGGWGMSGKVVTIDAMKKSLEKTE